MKFSLLLTTTGLFVLISCLSANEVALRNDTSARSNIAPVRPNRFHPIVEEDFNIVVDAGLAMIRSSFNQSWFKLPEITIRFFSFRVPLTRLKIFATFSATRGGFFDFQTLVRKGYCYVISTCPHSKQVRVVIGFGTLVVGYKDVRISTTLGSKSINADAGVPINTFVIDLDVRSNTNKEHCDVRVRNLQITRFSGIKIRTDITGLRIIDDAIDFAITKLATSIRSILIGALEPAIKGVLIEEIIPNFKEIICKKIL